MKPVVILGVVLAVLAVVLYFQFAPAPQSASEEKADAIRDNVTAGMDWKDVVDKYQPNAYMVHGDTSGPDGGPASELIDTDKMAASVSDGSFTQGFRLVYFITTDQALAVEIDSSGKVIEVNDYTPLTTRGIR